MSEELDRLHRATTGRRGYEIKRVAWLAYHAYADALAAQLPFAWKSIAMDNPTQNHTGTTNGANHIVVQEAISIGRIHRAARAPLCGRETANLWAVPAGGPTCKRCLEVAERLLDAARAEERS